MNGTPDRDYRRAQVAARTPEPDWNKLKLGELEVAERKAMDRVASGDGRFQAVLERIREARGAKLLALAKRKKKGK